MTRVQLTYGGLLYLDRTLPLLLGDVRIPGVDLNYVTFNSPGDLFRRQAQFAEFDLSEMSLGTYLIMTARGDDRFVGLPIFVSRNFRHSQIYVNKRAGIDRPEDLRGRRVGILEYQMTAALWIRAFLQHDYGIKPSDVHWLTGGLFESRFAERLPLDLPPEISLQQIPDGSTLEAMLHNGELDALVTVQPPQYFNESADCPVRRLFGDYRSVERDYFARTGHFPIMHLLVLRREIYESHRWLPATLHEGFLRAKHAGIARLRSTTGLAVGTPWLGHELAEIDELFRGDAFPYGVEENRAVLTAMAQYAHEQHMTDRLVDVLELFPPEAHQTPVPL
jgi:4,5-dihydroxyphthalate decarboxylase